MFIDDHYSLLTRQPAGLDPQLASVGALYLPFGSRWMRLEVVDGKTPFLLSNAFLRALGADVCSSAQELVVPKLGVRIPLQCDSKGLYQVELADVLTRLVRN